VSIIKELLCKLIESERKSIIDIGNDLFMNPELGFKEFRTAGIAASFLKDIGIEVQENISITGLKATINGSGHSSDSNKKHVNIGLIAELMQFRPKGINTHHKIMELHMHAHIQIRLQ
jgi:metal-dependent amidase/aminoacylase/carboxypeptidase family protein